MRGQLRHNPRLLTISILYGILFHLPVRAFPICFYFTRVREARQVINLWIVKMCFYFKMSWQSFVIPEDACEALLWDNEFAAWVETLPPRLRPGTSARQEGVATSSRLEERPGTSAGQEGVPTSAGPEERPGTSARVEERPAKRRKTVDDVRVVQDSFVMDDDESATFIMTGIPLDIDELIKK